ncbi:MAG TPA: methyltransferase domain-containing protein [Pirellulales bacterium]|jgi:SAM-dependent methyltransferase|nr:methyltransferase domain-containing protein [Pirellulales bacterium]
MWDATLYDAKHSFVFGHGQDLVELLAPRPGESIVDLGCGTGHLTARIAELGANVIGIDQSSEMIAQARQNHPAIDFQLADATSFTVPRPVDALFSNAALHWVRPPGDAAEHMAAALQPGGRLVAEFGGHGNVARVVAALAEVTSLPPADTWLWYFPHLGEYTALVEQHGFEVRQAALFDRPQPLEDGGEGMRNWLLMFAAQVLDRVDADRRDTVIAAALSRLRSSLWDGTRWTVDYRRLRLVAVRV